jgi:Flp pilus assembly pilin Flp
VPAIGRVKKEASMFRSGPAVLFGRFLRDTGGATAIEYALIAAGIGAAVAGAVWNLGAEVKSTLWDKIGAMF